MSLLGWTVAGLATTLALYAAAVIALVVAGRRTDARALAGIAPDCAVLLRRLARERKLSWPRRLAVAACAGYVLFPIDVVPDAIPVAGQVDDAIVVALGLRIALRGAQRRGDRAELARPAGVAAHHPVAGGPEPASQGSTLKPHGSRPRLGALHGVRADADRRALGFALALIVGFMGVEVVVGILASSLALISDAAHMLTDAGAIALSLIAARLAARPAGGPMTYGLGRAEILSAQVNGATLLVLGLLIVYEGVHRLFDPPAVDALPVLAVAVTGIGVNLAAVGILGRANRASLNVYCGDIIPDHDTLHIRLDPLPAPRHTAALDELCQVLNDTDTVYPGTGLNLRYSIKSHRSPRTNY